jgi:hypothetical protein
MVQARQAHVLPQVQAWHQAAGRPRRGLGGVRSVAVPALDQRQFLRIHRADAQLPANSQTTAYGELTGREVHGFVLRWKLGSVDRDGNTFMVGLS